MELFLNATWLLLVTAGASVWLWHARGTPVTKLLIGLIAISCIAALLAPVISMDDDLRCDEMTPENSWSRVTKARFWSPATIDSASIAVTRTWLLCPLFYVLGFVVAEATPVPQAFARSAPAGRSPPAFSA